MIAFPNVKINLGLNVLRRRADGYHDLDTVMFPVPFCDILEVLPAEDGSMVLDTSGLEIPGEPHENLVMKAYGLFSKKTGNSGARIHLHKVVPPGSGLGGGSSDAAHALILLNKVFNAGLDDGELLEMASRLGSDCPFFIRNRPSRATGRGEVLEEVSVNIAGKSILLVMPGIAVSTRWAYSAIRPRKAEISPKEAVKMDISNWKDLLVNDFEGPVFREYPVLRGIRDRLYELGAVYAAMSGSGSAVYGIFESLPVSPANDFKGCITWTGRML